eukprot:CAMPEP_0202867502 /NCGR_PEP_ID=MMETSP1391-20130828/9467_1 /ASSEMBLY_ACC=CAM_ASM_000867 /TAXON_ID=1034604 /ORGANISM="Chlamydomonas leiostraca, Strain SAG 11-49" /LENGTH=275 /DNA_ID=CAMNT_0049547551 /DNA_START=99 /DNA_END=926 /DNA_ORIENTATION=+
MIGFLLHHNPSWPHAEDTTNAAGAWGLHAWRGFSATTRYTDDYDKHHRVNHGIQKKLLQVIFPDGHSELLNRKDALKAAAQLKLDLVEFKGPESATGPAVAKITSYKSLRIQHSEKRQEEIRRAHELKSAAASGSGAGSAAGSRAGKGGAKAGPSKAEASGKGLKAKEVFFSPKIAAHDIEIRTKKIRQWLQDGYKVHVSREVDVKDSDKAAVLAIDSLVAALADAGQPDKKKHITPTMVSVTLLPLGAASQPRQQQGKKKQKQGEPAAASGAAA